MRGWRWWGYITAESLTVFGLGLWMFYGESGYPNDQRGVVIGTMFMLFGFSRFVAGARNPRAKFGRPGYDDEVRGKRKSANGPLSLAYPMSICIGFLALAFGVDWMAGICFVLAVIFILKGVND